MTSDETHRRCNMEWTIVKINWATRQVDLHYPSLSSHSIRLQKDYEEAQQRIRLSVRQEHQAKAEAQNWRVQLEKLGHCHRFDRPHFASRQRVFTCVCRTLEIAVKIGTHFMYLALCSSRHTTSDSDDHVQCI